MNKVERLYTLDDRRYLSPLNPHLIHTHTTHTYINIYIRQVYTRIIHVYYVQVHYTSYTLPKTVIFFTSYYIIIIHHSFSAANKNKFKNSFSSLNINFLSLSCLFCIIMLYCYYKFTTVELCVCIYRSITPKRCWTNGSRDPKNWYAAI